MLNATDIPNEVRRLLAGEAGKTAPAWPRDPAFAAFLTFWGQAYIIRASATTRAQRAAFIRKLAVFTTRTGHGYEQLYPYWLGATWFTSHPHHLATRLSFGGAVRQQQRHMLAEANTANREFRRDIARDLSRPMTPPESFIREEGLRLERLTHPQHLIDVGIIADNCLRVRDGDAVLPNRLYWCRVDSGAAHIFTLWLGDALAAVFAVHGTTVREMQIIGWPRDILHALERAAAVLKARMGVTDALPGILWFPLEGARGAPSLDPDQFAFFADDNT